MAAAGVPRVFPRVSFEQFSKAMMAIGRADKVAPNKTAVIPAWLLELSFGPALDKEHKDLTKRVLYKSSAQLCAQHKAEDLMGQLVLAVINFPRKQVGKEMSDCLVTGVQKELPDSAAKRETTVFMKPSCEVEPGSRVGITGDKVGPIHSNKRDCSWVEFMNLDLRIGEVVSVGEPRAVAVAVHELMLEIDLGELGKQLCLARVDGDFDRKGLCGKQVLVLTNLDEVSKAERFGRTDFGSILCTVEGSAVLEPAKRVENGYKLA